MNCHYCGAEMIGQEIFCRCCGTRQIPAPIQEMCPAAEVAVPVCEAPVPMQPEPIPAAEPLPYVWQSLEEKPLPNVAPLFGLEETPLSATPRIQLPTGRGLGKMLLLGILTLGIYPTVIWSRISGEINMVASRYDGERTLSFFGMLLLAPLTLGILPLVWTHKLCRRIGAELERRDVVCVFGPKAFWLLHFLPAVLCCICSGAAGALGAMGSLSYGVIWALLAVSLLCLIGPFVFLHKLMQAMNLLNQHFNQHG